jgi:hypothetical protein
LLAAFESVAHPMSSPEPADNRGKDEESSAGAVAIEKIRTRHGSTASAEMASVCQDQRPFLVADRPEVG